MMNAAALSSDQLTLVLPAIECGCSRGGFGHCAPNEWARG